MQSVVALLAPVAFWLSSPAVEAADPVLSQTVQHTEEGQEAPPAGKARMTRTLPEWLGFIPVQRIDSVRQVRIERRVILRISPRRPSNRQSLLRELPRTQPAANYEERKMGKCLPANSILGVQPTGENTLRLYLRDRRIVNLRLTKSCPAQSFYSGFYVERHEDGQLCVKRDLLHSRSGTKCTVSAMRQLVPVRTR